jgi:hypothetical protein
MERVKVRSLQSCVFIVKYRIDPKTNEAWNKVKNDGRWQKYIWNERGTIAGRIYFMRTDKLSCTMTKEDQEKERK